MSTTDPHPSGRWLVRWTSAPADGADVELRVYTEEFADVRSAVSEAVRMRALDWVHDVEVCEGLWSPRDVDALARHLGVNGPVEREDLAG